MEGDVMFTRIAFRTVRVLFVIALAAAVGWPVALAAQQPTITSAVIRWVSPGIAAPADYGKARLIVKIGGLPAEQLRTLKLQDLVIAGSGARRYTPEAVGFAARDPLHPENAADRRYIFTVPQGQTAFELRLRSFPAVPFLAAVSLRP
jgi:hypothetical protein